MFVHHTFCGCDCSFCVVHKDILFMKSIHARGPVTDNILYTLYNKTGTIYYCKCIFKHNKWSIFTCLFCDGHKGRLQLKILVVFTTKA